MKPMEYRFRPKGEYVMQASMQELYLLAEHYKKDLSFYIDEILFFEKLIANYNPSANVNLAKMDQLVKNAVLLLKNILAQIEEHLKHIAEVIQKEGDSEMEPVLREEQLMMEDTLTTFADSFRTLKSALFTEVGRHIQLYVPGKN
jgi:hypothetical protein